MQSNIRSLCLCALMAALTAVGAFVRIPLVYSTITLQFFFTALAGILLGPWWGGVSQLVYVALGLLGLPVFASGGGIGYFLQPSCGFVLALPFASLLIGLVAKGCREPGRIILASLAGLGAVYAIGLSYMACVLNLYLGKSLNLWQLAMAGMLPYLPGDALKIAALTVLCRKLPKALFQAKT